MMRLVSFILPILTYLLTFCKTQILKTTFTRIYPGVKAADVSNCIIESIRFIEYLNGTFYMSCESRESRKRMNYFYDCEMKKVASISSANVKVLDKCGFCDGKDKGTVAFGTEKGKCLDSAKNDCFDSLSRPGEIKADCYTKTKLSPPKIEFNGESVSISVSDADKAKKNIIIYYSQYSEESNLEAKQVYPLFPGKKYSEPIESLNGIFYVKAVICKDDFRCSDIRMIRIKGINFSSQILSPLMVSLIPIVSVFGFLFIVGLYWILARQNFFFSSTTPAEENVLGNRRIVKFPYEAQNIDELSVEVGEIVVILPKEGTYYEMENDGWLLCLKDGERGLIPAAYLGSLDGSEVHPEDDDIIGAEGKTKTILSVTSLRRNKKLSKLPALDENSIFRETSAVYSTKDPRLSSFITSSSIASKRTTYKFNHSQYNNRRNQDIESMFSSKR